MDLQVDLTGQVLVERICRYHDKIPVFLFRKVASDPFLAGGPT